jgi:manganese/zinc/iron transport system permease protein
MAHATLPGRGAAFLVMVALGGTGRALSGLMQAPPPPLSWASSPWRRLATRTRLPEDAAIGRGPVGVLRRGARAPHRDPDLSAGQQAGLESFLHGSTAGMLRADALTVAAGASSPGAVTWAIRRPMTTVAFDEGFAAASGLNVPRIDRVAMLLVLFVTWRGSRSWARPDRGASHHPRPSPPASGRPRVPPPPRSPRSIGGASGWIGTALSAAAPGLPAGPSSSSRPPRSSPCRSSSPPARRLARALATRRAAPRLAPEEAALWVALRRADPPRPSSRATTAAPPCPRSSRPTASRPASRLMGPSSSSSRCPPS